MKTEDLEPLILEKSNDDPTRLQELYNATLWLIVTANIDDLAKIASELFNDPYIYLPTPLKVTIYRLLILGSSSEEVVDNSRFGLSMYCDPEEERRIT